MRSSVVGLSSLAAPGPSAEVAPGQAVLMTSVTYLNNG